MWVSTSGPEGGRKYATAEMYIYILLKLSLNCIIFCQRNTARLNRLCGEREIKIIIITSGEVHWWYLFDSNIHEFLSFIPRKRHLLHTCLELFNTYSYKGEIKWRNHICALVSKEIKLNKCILFSMNIYILSLHISFSKLLILFIRDQSRFYNTTIMFIFWITNL